MGIGNALLNWGILALGVILFCVGCFLLVQYSRQYKRYVTRHGRISTGKKYGTSWTSADAMGVFIFPIVFPTGLIGALLFFFTSLPDIGIPLWIGCTLSIVGILLFLYAIISITGLTTREAALRDRLKDEKQRRGDNTE